MKTAFLRQRWFFSLIGVVALGALIWFLGPLWSPLAPSSIRGGIIVALASLWGGWWGWHWWRAYRHSRKLAEGIAAMDEIHRAIAEEEAVLAERFREALAVLQRARFKGQKLYQLPWYVLIGPPGVGKTTLLVNSDLHFPLAERFGREALRGVGGTRNCDWWFADEAVLLDTAGRYTTQESRQEVDRSAWFAFLDLLKKHRSRRPLNGVLVVVGIKEILTQNEDERHAHAKAIRQRIQELYQRLGVRLPIYFIINKSDLIAGFNEYFADLTSEERDQVWGMTFPLEEKAGEEGQVRHFEGEFNLLAQRLHEQMDAKLAREVNLERRERIFLFPYQFESLRALLSHFLTEIFRPSRFEEPVFLRGVYFTSATQEGSPIDRILASLAQTFRLAREALPRFSGKGRAYFINDLLRKVIFAEAGLAGTNWRQEKRRRRLRMAALGTMGAFAFGIVGLWGWSAFNNRSHVQEVKVQTQQLRQAVADLEGKTDLSVWLPVLDRARHLATITQESPWRRNFGLSQDDKLREGAQTLYQRLLLAGLLPQVMAAMEQGVQDAMGDPRLLYPALKAYLMLDDPEHYEAKAVYTWIVRYWQATLFSTFTEDERRSLKAHLEALLAKRPAPLPRALDTRLVQEARAALANRPLAEQVYDTLKSQFPGDRIPPFVPSQVLGPEGVLVFRRLSGRSLTEGLSGLFTYAGYHDYVADAITKAVDIFKAERWIYGEQIASASQMMVALRQEVLTLYAKEYIHRWQQLLADVTFQAPRNLDHAIEMLKILSGPDSPYKRWLTAVAHETHLESEAQGEAERPSPPLPPPIAAISEHFAQIQRLVTSPKEGVAPIDVLLDQLKELRVHLEAFNEALASGNAQLVAEQGQRVKNTLRNLEMVLDRQPKAVAQSLGKLADQVQLMTAGGRRQYLNAIWTSEVLPFCRRAIAGRYPIVADSPHDITLDDFAHFFGPQGLMANFFNQYLASSVDRSRSPWRWNPNERAVISSQALRQFEIAEEIRNVFFGASAKPLLRFSLEPISMSMDVVKAELDIDGQLLTYEHGPTQPKWFRWPGKEAGNVVRLRFLPPVAGQPSGIQRTGPWAWLRLLDSAEVIKTTLPEEFLVTFRVGGRYLKLMLRASSVFNPFGNEVIHRFQCLPHL